MCVSNLALFFRLSPVRRALQRLQWENRALRESQGRPGAAGLRTVKTKNLKGLTLEEEEEKEDSEEEEEDIEEEEPQNVAVRKRGPPCVSLSGERGKRQCTRPQTYRHRQPETVTQHKQYLNEVMLLSVWLTTATEHLRYSMKTL